ncbi:MAG: uroporphyrinogen decarboxylase family protein [Phycisphaerae bacterium]|jgi:uroporphyrinogen decarboxylase
MTPRQRFIETMTFGHPDKIPFTPGWPRESTLEVWRTQGMPKGVDWNTCVLETLDLDPACGDSRIWLEADFRMMPHFEEKVLEHRDGHYVVQDWKGNVCEISDTFDVTYLREARDFVTRRWIKCPVENRDDWEAMKARYDIDTPGRWPADFLERCRKAKNRDAMLGCGGIAGPFWQLREWCGFEGLCFMMVEQPELVDEMAAFWNDFVAGILKRIVQHVVPDELHFNEDMAYKAKAMISPAMTRRFCKPSYDNWSKIVRDAGVPLVGVDSDGFVGELIPIWLESGLNFCDPMEVAAHNDINEFRRLYGRKMAYRGGIDKRAMARGGETLRAELKRIEPVVRDGGFIPGCDHAVPSDVSWPDYLDYARQLAIMTGWK